MLPRFVILEHRWRGVHLDVMLERGDALVTWAVDSPVVANLRRPARSLPDHRLAYLDFEGPVSGDRGSVSRIAQGIYIVREWRVDLVEVVLDGLQLRGPLLLERDEEGDWSFLFRPGNAI